MYNFNELGLQKCTSWLADESDHSEKTYRCASHEMRIFGAIGSGASSVVQRAVHIPTHRIIALKKINIFEKVCMFSNLLYSFLCFDGRIWLFTLYMLLLFTWKLNHWLIYVMLFRKSLYSIEYKLPLVRDFPFSLFLKKKKWMVRIII